MGFLDKFLNRAKETASTVADKAGPTLESAVDKAGDLASQAKEAATPPTTSGAQVNSSLPAGTEAWCGGLQPRAATACWTLSSGFTLTAASMMRPSSPITKWLRAMPK